MLMGWGRYIRFGGVWRNCNSLRSYRVLFPTRRNTMTHLRKVLLFICVFAVVTSCSPAQDAPPGRQFEVGLVEQSQLAMFRDAETIEFLRGAADSDRIDLYQSRELPRVVWDINPDILAFYVQQLRSEGIDGPVEFIRDGDLDQLSNRLRTAASGEHAPLLPDGRFVLGNAVMRETSLGQTITGRLVGTPRGLATFSIIYSEEGEELNGVIKDGRAVYSIETLPFRPDVHVLIPVDASTSPLPDTPRFRQTPTDTSGTDPNSNQGNIFGERAVETQEDDVITITVLLGYTPAARNGWSDRKIKNRLQNWALNWGSLPFEASDMRNINFEMIGPTLIEYTERDSLWEDHQALVQGEGELQRLHQYRQDHRADVVGLLVGNNNDGRCGESGVIGAENEDAFFVLNHSRSCLLYHCTFAHEIAHLLGAAHNPEAAGSHYVEPSYARGFVNKAEGWRTVVTVHPKAGCLDNKCDIELFFSSPSVERAPGVPTGILNTHDNVRVIKANLHRLAQFGEEL